ncbi:UDP-3-O-(3-hydroxymyristoyl)glucosamine N-acyltransferase [Porphyromonas macacae]|uniref:UDP-3-O-(3-hydroxymyristoyl)glucosamine N-acyltransferase n=1 Tax=Porphyromonas macacae TaxID=28115 RepID=UPI0035A035C0
MIPEFSVEQIAAVVGGTIEGDPSAKVSAFGKIEDAKSGDLTFLANEKYESFIYTTKATAVLVNKTFEPREKIEAVLIRVPDAYAALAQLLQMMQQAEKADQPVGIHPTAIVAEGVIIPEDAYVGAYAYVDRGCVIGSGCCIYPYVYIGKGVQIGEQTEIYPHATVYSGVKIGRRCLLHAGVVIGADGFGFAPEEDGYHKIPQLGGVILEDDVEIGANTCVDRAVMGNTIVSKGVKLDNLVQIAHNCVVGKHTVMAAQAGLAGSTHVGEWCQLGGQVGVAGHLKIGNHVKAGGQTGILGNIEDGKNIMGSPAMEAGKAMRTYVQLSRLSELEKRVKELEKKLYEKEKQ